MARKHRHVAGVGGRPCRCRIPCGRPKHAHRGYMYATAHRRIAWRPRRRLQHASHATPQIASRHESRRVPAVVRACIQLDQVKSSHCLGHRLFPLSAAKGNARCQEKSLYPQLGAITPVVQIIKRVQDVLEEAPFRRTIDHPLILAAAQRRQVIPSPGARSLPRVAATARCRTGRSQIVMRPATEEGTIAIAGVGGAALAALLSVRQPGPPWSTSSTVALS